MTDKNYENHDDRQVSYDSTSSMKGTSGGKLRHLDDLDDVEITDGEPDPRGWDVKTPDGEKVGEVAGLLVDTGAMQVRYLELKLE